MAVINDYQDVAGALYRDARMANASRQDPDLATIGAILTAAAGGAISYTATGGLSEAIVKKLRQRGFTVGDSGADDIVSGWK